MHPAKEIQGSKSSALSKKRIVLGVSGSIAAVESIRLAREFIRHDAEVIPVMTNAATSIIHPDALWFATGHRPIVSLTGETEHVKWCGKGKDKVDALVISPCTANTISKIAYGIDDTPVSTFATTAIGSQIPVIIVPAMHLSMYDHDIVQENVQKLRNHGIVFIDPFIDKTKAKMASIEHICLGVQQVLGSHDLQKKKVLVIGGGTAEPVDAVRTLSNTSSGTMAISLALQAFLRDAEVHLWYGCASEPIPDVITKTHRFKTIDELNTLINDQQLVAFDIIIVCAALSDFIPKKTDEKFSSDLPTLSITCESSPKILPLIRRKTKDAILVGFKLEKKKKELVNKAFLLLKKDSLDFVVANTIENVNSSEGEVWVVDKESNQVHIKGEKDQIAAGIYDKILDKDH